MTSNDIKNHEFDAEHSLNNIYQRAKLIIKDLKQKRKDVIDENSDESFGTDTE